MSLQVVQVRDDLLSKLGIEDATTAGALALQDVVVAINGALQMLQTAGQDYFTRELLSVTLIAGSSQYSIAKSIQAVIGPIRWNNSKPLRALTSQGELDQYSRIFEGSSGYGSSEGEPNAYWVQNLRQGSVGDIDQINLFIVPVPTSPAGTLLVEVVNDAPAYVVADLTSTNAVPVAQNYTESIFLPLARMLVTRSSQFSRPDILEQLTVDYQRAMATLGFSGGFPNADQPEPERTVKA